MPPVVTHLAAAIALALAAIVVPTTGNGGRIYAQTAAQPFVAFGFIATGEGSQPSKVRATIGDVVCGTSDIIHSDNTRSFYVVVVAEETQKAGCGVWGAPVHLQLLNGDVDPGASVAQVLFRPGEALRVDLAAAARPPTGVFSGRLPDGPGAALLRWTGGSGVSIQQAIATIQREVVSVYYWDVQRQVFRSYVAGAAPEQQTYTMVDADDTVLVHVR